MSTLTGGPAPQLPIPRNPEVKAYLYANAVVGETRRYRQLDRYEAFYAARQYAHHTVDWWGMNADQMETVSPEVMVPYGFTQPALANVSVRQKRPTAPFNVVKAVVDRFTGLLFSEQRKPELIDEGDPDTEEFLRATIEQMRFWPKMREARTLGGATGSVLVTVHLRNGKFSLEVHNTKHCQVVWKDRRMLVPLAILKIYKYTVEEDVLDERTGEFKGSRPVDYLYRRIITEEDDTVFRPARLDKGTRPNWEVESEVQHNLGFFPGVWIQNLPQIENIDGEPDCQGAWQTVDTIDRLISQMNRGVLLNLDPTLALSVDPRVIESMGGTVRKGSDNALMLGQGGSASYLEIGGGGVNAGMTVYQELRKNVLDVVRCVLVDPGTIAGAAQSAKAIEYIYAPMLEKADDLRASYGDLGVMPLLKLVEAIARKVSSTTHDLGIGQNGLPRIGRVKFDLPPRRVPTGVVGADGKPEYQTLPHKLGPGGHLRLKWGSYFSPTEQDKQQAVSTLVAAKSGGIIDSETAVRQGASIFGVLDPDSLLQKIKAEQAEQQQSQMGMGYGAYGGGAPEEEPAVEDETALEQDTSGGPDNGPGAGEGGLP